MLKQLASVSLIALTLTACQDSSGRPWGGNQTGGTILGAIGGAAIGSQFGHGTGRVVGIAAGTLLGAALGNSIGASMDRQSMEYYNRTSQQALETGRSGQPAQWRNPDNGNYGSITPTNTYTGASGQYCREYTQTINIGGQVHQGYGTACRQPDGTWQIQQ